MNKSELSILLEFPPEWERHDFYLDAIFRVQHKEIVKEEGVIKPFDTEHFRYSAFLWWLNNYKSDEELNILEELAISDPDKPMGRAIVRDIESIRQKTKKNRNVHRK